MNPQQPDNPQPPLAPTPPEQPAGEPVAPALQEVPAVESQPPVVESQPEVAPVAAPEVAAPAPVVESQPTPTPAPETPVQPVAAPQSFPSTPTDQAGGVPPQDPVGGGPTIFGAGPAPAPTKDNKLVILIAAIAGGAVVLGLIVWVLIAFVFNSIALETYKGDGYSVLVPKDYEKDESATSVTFKEPDADDDDQSQVSILSVPIKDALTVMDKDDLVKLYDDMFSQDNLTEAAGFSDESIVKNFNKETMKYQGHDARKITFDVERDGKRTGTGYVLLVFGDEAFYGIAIAAHASDPGVNKAANKILNSLEIDE